MLALGLSSLLAGCTAAASPPPTGTIPAASPVETASPRATPRTPSPLPSDAEAATPPADFPAFPTLPPSDERVRVFGNLDCGIEGITETDEDQTTVYHGKLVCWHQMSDPRVNGREESDMTVIYLKIPGLTMDKWSYPTGTLINDGGTWRASGWGSEFWDDKDQLRTSGTSYYVGEGGYAGLVYRLLYAQGPETAPYGYLAAGWIEPAD